MQVADIHAAALAEDASVFDYDAHYDAIQETRAEPKRQEKMGRQSRYIAGLLETAEERKREQDILYERQLAKERAAEDHLFGDKERFVTAAYRRKLEEDAKWKQEQKQLCVAYLFGGRGGTLLRAGARGCLCVLAATAGRSSVCIPACVLPLNLDYSVPHLAAVLRRKSAMPWRNEGTWAISTATSSAAMWHLATPSPAKKPSSQSKPRRLTLVQQLLWWHQPTRITSCQSAGQRRWRPSKRLWDGSTCSRLRSTRQQQQARGSLRGRINHQHHGRWSSRGQHHLHLLLLLHNCGTKRLPLQLHGSGTSPANARLLGGREGHPEGSHALKCNGV